MDSTFFHPVNRTFPCRLILPLKKKDSYQVSEDKVGVVI